MNDFLKAMGQFGMEGLGIEPAEVSLEQEMNEEIAMEAELDEAYAQMDFANIVASTSQCEAILTAMAEREIGLESNAGRDAATIYGEFGLEAIKDVAMRKVYSGWASLKALINTCINWLKQLVGIQTASKKIFAGLAKKAKAMKKQLGKVQSKVSDKLKREMPDYSDALNKLIAAYGSTLGEVRDKKNGFVLADAVAEMLGMNETQVDSAIQDVQGVIDELKEASERMSEDDIYDKKDTSDYEGSTCYSRIMSVISDIEAMGKHFKHDDIVKIINTCIKNLEKVRKELDKNAKNPSAPQPAQNVGRLLNKLIENYTKTSTVAKKCLKLVVKISDDALTMGKGIYATLV